MRCQSKPIGKAILKSSLPIRIKTQLKVAYSNFEFYTKTFYFYIKSLSLIIIIYE